MIAVQILEAADLIDPEDWCRPLALTSMSGGLSDSYSFRSCYSGTPENNVKWVQVRHVLGKTWHGQSVGEYNRRVGVRYEFIRGAPPLKHRLNMRDYTSVDN